MCYEELSRINLLIDKVKRNEDQMETNDDLDFIKKCLKSFPDYFSCVVEMQYTEPILRIDFGENEKYEFQKMDRERRQKHILLCDSINKLNRLCEYYKTDRIFETDELDGNNHNDRNIAAKYAAKVCLGYFSESRDDSFKKCLLAELNA